MQFTSDLVGCVIAIKIVKYLMVKLCCLLFGLFQIARGAKADLMEIDDDHRPSHLTTNVLKNHSHQSSAELLAAISELRKIIFHFVTKFPRTTNFFNETRANFHFAQNEPFDETTECLMNGGWLDEKIFTKYHTYR